MMWKDQRRKKLQSTPVPLDWKRIVETRCPFYHQLSETDRRELERYILAFLAEKKFEVCDGLVINDELRISSR
jgi:MtfA peptidase